jgi:type II secretory pathway pseudopilin PulG
MPLANKMPKNQKKKPKFVAFTLIELLITLGILGGIMAVTLPRIWFYQKEETLDYAAQNIVNFINQAHNLAVYRRQESLAEKEVLGIKSGIVKEVKGTVVTFEPPDNDYTWLSIREWSLPKTDDPEVDFSQKFSNLPPPLPSGASEPHNVGKTVLEIIRDYLHTDSCDGYTEPENKEICLKTPLYFPIISTLRLPKDVKIFKDKSNLSIFNEQNSPSSSPFPSASPDDEKRSQPYIVFLGYRNGEASLKVYGLTGERGFFTLCVGYENGSNRKIMVSVPQGNAFLVPGGC